MYLTTSLLFAAAGLIPSTLAQNASTKRGLVFVPNPKFPTDNQIWVENNNDGQPSDLTWYYNYGTSPSSAYSNRSQSEFEFVPMLYSPTTTFLSSIQSLVSGGTNISHVLTYNEPDGTTSTGGTAVDPSVAATNWISQVEPLRKMGIKTGAPAVTGGPGGFTWLASFFSACASQGTNCTADFIPIHWYGNFAGLASHIGQVVGTYPNTSIWVTEYAENNVSLIETQDFYNETADYFDNKLPYLERYSYFGAFRSDVSNVGPNAALLNNKGQLTDMGSWYLGGKSTGTQPGGSAASRTDFGRWSIFVCIVAVFMVV